MNFYDTQTLSFKLENSIISYWMFDNAITYHIHDASQASSKLAGFPMCVAHDRKFVVNIK